MGQVIRLHQGTGGQANGQASGRLTELLRALATAQACPDEQPGRDGITEILRRVDATVLPREVRVMVQGREVLCLLIANRRLLRAACPGNDECASEPSDPKAAAEKFAAVLRHHLPDGALTLRIARPAAEMEMPDLGCDGEQLSRALGVVRAPESPQSALGLDARVQSLAVAWVRQQNDGRILSRGGDAHAAVLDAVVTRADWPALLEDTHCLLLPGPAGLDLSVTMGAGERLICLSPANMRTRLYAAWAAGCGAG